MPDIKWLDSPEAKDYDAAEDFLSLILPAREAENVASLLETDPSIVWHPAKDLFRASHLDLLPKSNKHVAHNLKKIEKGEPLSPILLVRGKRDKGVPLTIADGFHRLSAVYHASEDALIPAKIVSA